MLQPQPFQVKFHRFLHVFFYLLFGLVGDKLIGNPS